MNMRQLIIKGNVMAPELITVGEGYIETFSELDNVSEDAIVIEGNVVFHIEQKVDYQMLITGETTCREV